MGIEIEHTTKQAVADLPLQVQAVADLQMDKPLQLAAYMVTQAFCSDTTCMQLHGAMSCQLKCSLGCMWTR